METIHIRKLAGQWYAKAGNWSSTKIQNTNKNLVVQKAVLLSKKLFAKAKVIIYSANGQVLEERIIENN